MTKRRFQTGALGSKATTKKKKKTSGGTIDYYKKKAAQKRKESKRTVTTKSPSIQRGKSTPSLSVASSRSIPLTADTEDLPGTWNLMNQITALQGPEKYPGLANFADKVGFTDEEVQGYVDAVDTFSAGQAGTGGPAALPPAPPAAPGEDGYKMFKWKTGGYEAAGGNVPDWWEAFVPEEVTPETSYGAMLNAMIPYLSAQDQVRVAHSLYGMFDTEMSHYKPGAIPEISTVTEDQMRYMKREGRPTAGMYMSAKTGKPRGRTEIAELSDESRRYLQSSQRAQQAITTLSNMRESMVQGNRWKLGPGYKWLQNVMESVAGAGAGGQSGQTRFQYQNMLSAVDPFLSQAGGGELQAFGPLGQMATKPFSAAGSVTPRFANNRFGTPNRRFF